MVGRLVKHGMRRVRIPGRPRRKGDSDERRSVRRAIDGHTFLPQEEVDAYYEWLARAGRLDDED